MIYCKIGNKNTSYGLNVFIIIVTFFGWATQTKATFKKEQNIIHLEKITQNKLPIISDVKKSYKKEMTEQKKH